MKPKIGLKGYWPDTILACFQIGLNKLQYSLMATEILRLRSAPYVSVMRTEAKLRGVQVSLAFAEKCFEEREKAARKDDLLHSNYMDRVYGCLDSGREFDPRVN